MLNILLVDEYSEHIEPIGQRLEQAGCDFAVTTSALRYLVGTVEQTNPDVIVVNTDWPSREMLEYLGIVTRDHPRPIVMFARDEDQETIHAATDAGVSAYVIGGFDGARLKAIISAARARFAQIQRLRGNLALARSTLVKRELDEQLSAADNHRSVIIRA